MQRKPIVGENLARLSNNTFRGKDVGFATRNTMVSLLCNNVQYQVKFYRKGSVITVDVFHRHTVTRRLGTFTPTSVLPFLKLHSARNRGEEVW